VGSEEGENAAPFPREEGSSGRRAARAGGGGGSAQSGFRRKKTVGRMTGRAHLSVRGRRRAVAGPKGGGREVGHGGAKRGRERGGPRLGQKPEMDG
jgi:hypothetical protein